MSSLRILARTSPPVTFPPIAGQHGGIQWPTFTGTANFVGTSPAAGVSVYYDAALGSTGLTAAQGLLGDVDRVAAINNKIFGLSKYQSCNVIVFSLNGNTDGTGGADHLGCDFSTGGNIEVDLDIGSTSRQSALFEAEYSECCMHGDLCGYSTGEALSRWCAMITSDNALKDFKTAPNWSAQHAPDYVSNFELTDRDPVATGCGMVFISWMLSLGYSFPVIAQSLVQYGGMINENGAFAGLYSRLTGDSEVNAYPKFINACRALPGGIPLLNRDDAFNQLSGVIGSLG